MSDPLALKNWLAPNMKKDLALTSVKLLPFIGPSIDTPRSVTRRLMEDVSASWSPFPMDEAMDAEWPFFQNGHQVDRPPLPEESTLVSAQ